jgi:pyruvate dehydrogenase (quinone)
MLIEAAVPARELPIPPAIDLEMAQGFTLYMSGAAVNGRGEDLPRADLRR